MRHPRLGLRRQGLNRSSLLHFPNGWKFVDGPNFHRQLTRAFSSVVDPGSPEENASKQKPGAGFRFHQNRKKLQGSWRGPVYRSIFVLF
jgi:hypothetical protein